VGMKSRGVYETPGGEILYAAHSELEHIVLDKDTLHYKDVVAQRYAELVYNGQWYTPLREALDAFMESTQRFVSGTIKLKLYKGNIAAAGRKSPFSLYQEDLATFSQDEVYDQKKAEGFIDLFGLSMKVNSQVHGKPQE
ncbi:MAG: argininosuccinate synthase, partial [Candidatus Kryptoniota bacterium]